MAKLRGGWRRPGHSGRNVFSKLEVENRAQAIVQALKRGLVSLSFACRLGRIAAISGNCKR